MERWSGKVALVTGASAGIGESITEKLAKAGVKVVGLARRVERVEELKKKVGNVKGEIIPLKGDVSKEEDIEAAFKFIKEKFGAIHILVNNAGYNRVGSISEVDIEDVKGIINVNFIGLTICTQKALQLMKEAGVDDGHIIHINSVAGHYILNFGAPLMSVYASSKYAVTALTEVIRQELTFLKTKIRVTSVSPGPVATEFRGVASKGQKSAENYLKTLGKLPQLQSEDVADAVIYAISAPSHVQIHEIIMHPTGANY